MRLPSAVIKKFEDDYATSPELATDNYFDWSKKVNYVRAERMEKISVTFPAPVEIPITPTAMPGRL